MLFLQMLKTLGLVSDDPKFFKTRDDF